jgi:2-desacetyl-2-hydroxyethyl bacteriochlorophyllide A dehydrogenase
MTIINKVARLESPGKFVFTEEPIGEVADRAVVLQLIASGICSSEVPFFTGEAVADPRAFIKYARYPLDLGHELSGKVVAVGSKVTRFKEGDLATGITIYGSGFATHFVENEENLVLIPPGVDPRYALGEPITCAVNILRSTAPEIGDDVVVIGEGFMGLLMVQLLSRLPLRSLSVVGLVEDKLRRAREYGAHRTFRADDSAAMQELFSGVLQDRGAQAVIELAGNQKALELAAWLVKSRRGKLVIPSFYTGKVNFSIGGYLMRKGPLLIPAHPAYSPNLHDDLARGMWCLAQGVVSLKEMITHTFAFKDLAEAFRTAGQKGPDHIKSLVLF